MSLIHAIRKILHESQSDPWDQLVLLAEQQEQSGDGDLMALVDMFAEVLNGGVDQWVHNTLEGVGDIGAMGQSISNVLSVGGVSCSLVRKAVDDFFYAYEQDGHEEVGEGSHPLEDVIYGDTGNQAVVELLQADW